MNTRNLLRKFRHLNLVLAALLMLGLATTSANATALTYALNDSPDIYSSPLLFSYTGNSFSAEGAALQYFDGLDTFNITNGHFSMTGSFGSGDFGLITILGTLDGATSGTLLTGTLNNYGYSTTSGGVMEFLFAPTGGDLMAAYAPVSGIILGNFNWLGFGVDTDALSATTDTGTPKSAVPEPSSIALMLLGGLGMALARKRMNTNKA